MSEKRDFKLFREKIGGWQEDHMAKLNEEYIGILSRKDKNPSKNFWELYERMQKDKTEPGVLISDLRPSNFDLYLGILVAQGVIQEEDLEGFSEELKERIRYRLQD